MVKKKTNPNSHTVRLYPIKVSCRVSLNTSHAKFKNAKIQWKVRTAGVTDEFSNTAWSVERTIYIYEKPL